MKILLMKEVTKCTTHRDVRFDKSLKALSGMETRSLLDRSLKWKYVGKWSVIIIIMKINFDLHVRD